MATDLRHAVRSLLRSPKLTATIVLTLAIAVGSTGAVVNLLHAVVFRQLPARAPEQLVSVYPANGEAMLGIPGATLSELTRRQTVFQDVCGVSRGAIQITTDHGVLRRSHEGVGASCGTLLGVRMALGRFIDASDHADSVDAESVVVISDGLWRTEFGSDAALLGQTLRVHGLPLTVIGVLAPGAYSTSADQAPDLVTPIGLIPRLFGGPPRTLALQAFGRLREGATLASARAELRALWPAAWDATNAPVPGRPPSVARSADALIIEPFGGGMSELRVRYAASLYVLLGLAALLLTLAVVNVGGVLLARAIDRQYQLAIRLALGAGYRRLTIQLMWEGVAMAMLAGGLSIPMAWWISRVLVSTMWTSVLPLTLRVEPDATTLAAIALVAFASGLLVNLPAVRLLRTSPFTITAGATRTAFAATSWWRRSLMIGQVALSIVLVCAAALFTRSLGLIRSTNLGFQSAGLYVVSLEALAGTSRLPDYPAYLSEIKRELMAVPGIHDVTFSSRFPMSAMREVTSLLPNYRRAEAPVGSEVTASTETVATDFFQTLNIPFLKGRQFSMDDSAGHPRVAVINAALAQRLFPNHDAIGHQIKNIVAADPLTVIGIVANVTRGDPRITNAPTVYLPAAQEPSRLVTPIIIIRADSRQDLSRIVEAALAPSGRHTVAFVRSIDEQIDRHIARERVLYYLSAAAAAIGVLIGALGLAGLLTYTVTARTRELGLRMAIGATHGSLARMIVGEGMTLVALGITIGLPCAYGVGRLSSSLLEGIGAADPVSLTAAVTVMLAAGFAACALPVIRLVLIAPAEALRHD